MRKINIGAGPLWQFEEWEVLDNVPGKYTDIKKHFGKCWDSKLPSGSFDVIFCSHMLEHIPQFRLEKTIYEFNRILKIDGKIRILVPDLKKLALAYVKNDKKVFAGQKKYIKFMGVGSAFIRKILSPGGNTILISREFDEIIGSYGHLFAFDFEMLRLILTKWGFGDIKNCKIGQSSIREISKNSQSFVCGDKKYSLKDTFVKKKKYKSSNEKYFFTGFDKITENQLIVEAKKIKNVKYSKAYIFSDYYHRGFESPPDKIKISIIKKVVKTIDTFFSMITKLKSFFKN